MERVLTIRPEAHRSCLLYIEVEVERARERVIERMGGGWLVGDSSLICLHYPALGSLPDTRIINLSLQHTPLTLKHKHC